MGYELGLLVAALIAAIGLFTIVMAILRRPKGMANMDGAQISADPGVNTGAGSRASKFAGILLFLIGISLAGAMLSGMDFMMAVALPVGLLAIPFLAILLVRWIWVSLRSR